MRLDIGVSGSKELVEVLSRPYPEDVETARRLDGDVIVLGAGGKMGPTLVGRIVRALREAGSSHRVYAASRYSEREGLHEIEETGAEVRRADLLDDNALSGLPDCPNVVYLAGMKFGASARPSLTWALNTYLPGRVAARYRESRIVALSTGNVYPMVPPETGGCTEETEPGPVGEYAASCLGRERIFEHFSQQNGTPVCLLRLNYAVEARYGVLLDIANRVYHHEPVPLTMEYVNAIWQGDANSVIFRALDACQSPACVLNLTGPILSVRRLAEQFGARFGTTPTFTGSPHPIALLSNAAKCNEQFGPPRVPIEDVIDLVASWLEAGQVTYGKSTKFEVDTGRF